MTDVVSVTALGAPFSALALYLLRRRLFGGLKRFFVGLAIGLAGLAAATVFFTIYVSQPAAIIVQACLEAPDGARVGCEDAQLIVAVVFLAGLSACVLFLLGGFGLRLLRPPQR